jgi:Spy/CpxP family protein refolding chaperone
MNKISITIITTLLLTASGMALAQDFYGEPGNKGQRSQRGMQGAPMVDQLMRGIRRLDLEDEQRESIRAIMQGLKADTSPVMQKTKAVHLQLKELIKADVYDADAVAALAVQEGDFAAERMMITSRSLSQVYGQLTQEQRAELETMAAEHQERRTERREKRPGQS